MAKGGARVGAGRPSGVGNRPSILRYWEGAQYPDEVMKYFAHVTKTYKKSEKLTVWVGEQICGKAVQPIGNDEGKPLVISFDNAFTSSSK